MAKENNLDLTELTQSILTEQQAATDRHTALQASTPCLELFQEILRLKETQPDKMDVEARLKKALGDVKPNRVQRVVEFNNLIAEISENCNRPLNVLNGRICYYNGKYWEIIPEGPETDFLFSLIARYLGVDQYEAKYCDFLRKARESFVSSNRVSVSQRQKEILLNCKNGTVEITQDGKTTLRDHRSEDGLQYVLPYDYNPAATCPKFDNFLREVLPDPADRANLQEYVGSCFSHINHEQIAYLYGATGRNGKTTCKDIICAMFGKDNVSSASLDNLTAKGPGGDTFCAGLEGKLLNACGEIGNKIEESARLKTLASQETLSLRTVYAHTLRVMPAGSYARLLFCCNNLPVFKEGGANAEARRFLFIEFATEIPAEKVNRNLSREIIEEELAGVLNWAIEGLLRLSRQKGDFTHNPHSEIVKEQFLTQSNSVAAWLAECGYLPLTADNRRKYIRATPVYETGSALYGSKSSCLPSGSYRDFCSENGRLAQNRNKFCETLRQLHFIEGRKPGTGPGADTRCFLLLQLTEEERERRQNPGQTLF